jgi:hypothetical protein
MKARGVVGKRIAHIKQQVFTDPQRGRMVHVAWLELEDGTRLVPSVSETEGTDYAVDFAVRRPR